MTDSSIPVTDDHLMVHGLKLHYRDWGDRHNPPVVILHGLGAHARSWDRIAAGLADRFRVIVPDLRGHGRSSWAADYGWQRFLEDAAGLIDALGLRQCILCGHSLGGRVAYMLAGRYPERITRLVIAEAYPLEQDSGRAGSPPAPDVFPTFDAALAEAYRRQPDAQRDALRHEVEHGIQQLDNGSWIWRADPALYTASWRGQLKPGPMREWQALSDVRCPSALIYGTRSIPAARAAAVAQAMRNCQIIPLDASHDLPNDNPGALTAAMRAFLCR